MTRTASRDPILPQTVNPTRKPDSATAMRGLIARIRTVIPFDAPAAQSCSGICEECSMKLLDFLAAELEDRECRLNRGETPSLADLSRLIGTGQRVHAALQRNGLLATSSAGAGRCAFESESDGKTDCFDRG